MAQKQREAIVRDPPAMAKKIHVPTYEEILQRIKTRYPKSGRRPFDREMARLQATYDIMMSKTSFIRDLVRLVDGLHPFYWRLIEIDFDRRRIRESIKCVSKARKIASTIYEKYRFLLLASESRQELLRVSSEARGRILSTIKKCRRSLDYLRDLVVFIQHLPSVDPTLPTIIVAGAPSTGKSTLVRNVSRANTRVASYPFTTTTVHIGHYTLELEGGRKVKAQIIDTPGLLDRPPELMNPVERRAAAALAELEGPILFLVDVSGSPYMSVGRQFKLLSNIINIYARNRKVYVALNKVDARDEQAYSEALRIAEALKRSGAVSGVFDLVASDKRSATRLIEEIIKDSIIGES